MNQLKTLFNLSFNFTRKFWFQYLKLVIKPILIMLLSTVIYAAFLVLPSFNIALFNLGPMFYIIASIIYLVVFCYVFVSFIDYTYILNYAAYNFLKDPCRNTELKLYIHEYNPKRADFLFYLTISCILVIVLGLAIVLPVAFSNLSSINIYSLSTVDSVSAIFSNQYLYVPFIVFLVLILPTFYLFQSYFYRKENENYLNMFFNCYKNLDIIGFIVAFIGYLLTMFYQRSPFLVILAPFIIVFTTGLCNFWYYSRINSKTIKNS